MNLHTRKSEQPCLAVMDPLQKQERSAVKRPRWNPTLFRRKSLACGISSTSRSACCQAILQASLTASVPSRRSARRHRSSANRIHSIHLPTFSVFLILHTSIKLFFRQHVLSRKRMVDKKNQRGSNPTSTCTPAGVCVSTNLSFIFMSILIVSGFFGSTPCSRAVIAAPLSSVTTPNA